MKQRLPANVALLLIVDLSTGSDLPLNDFIRNTEDTIDQNLLPPLLLLLFLFSALFFKS